MRGKSKNAPCKPLNLYSEKLCISTAKFEDMQVLKKFTNRPDYFDSLPHDNNKNEVNGQEEFDYFD